MQSIKLYSRHRTFICKLLPLIIISGKGLEKAKRYQKWLSIDFIMFCISCNVKNIFLV